MSDNKTVKNRNVIFGLKMKIILTFFFISSMISLFLSISSYNILNRALFGELQAKVKNLTHIGSKTIDAAALKRLIALLSPGLNSDQVTAVERSPDYKIIYDQLNYIRNAEKKIIQYTYIFIPGKNENTSYFAVDADILTILDEIQKGKDVKEEEISHFNSVFDLTDYETAKEAVRQKATMVDKNYVYDSVYKINSITGYSPIFDENGALIAMLALDMSDRNVKESLRMITLISIAIALTAILLSLLISIFLGTVFTKGIIYLDNIVRKFGEKKLDVRAELKSRDEIGRLGSSFNFMAQTIQEYSEQLENLLTAYGRFVPHDFLQFLHKKSITDLKLGDQIQREMTLLFSDIRSFTTLSESMSPKDNFNFINSYLSRVGPEIRAHNGFIDKYIGDAVMALFPGNPGNAVDAGIAMLAKVKEYNEYRKNQGYAAINIGIGIHTGNLMLGTVGEEERMDSTVISDAVNLASRLEGLTKMYGVSILISRQALEKIEDRKKYRSRFLDKVQVKGKNIPVLIYEILNSLPQEVIDKRLKANKDFLNAVDIYYAKKMNIAEKMFTELKEQNPDDKLFDIYLTRCRSFIKYGIPEGWNGVVILDSK